MGTGQVFDDWDAVHAVGVDLVRLPDVGHYPHLEVPGRVAVELLRPFVL